MSNSASDRLEVLHHWLQDDLRLRDYQLTPASEDASFRRYFRISKGAVSRIIMDAPPDKEDCRPFVDVTERLLKGGINVPEIYASDLQQGFLLLSDLGPELYLQCLDDNNVDQLYADALNTLLRMQTEVSITGLPDYSEALLKQEMSLFTDWLLERHLHLSLYAADKRQWQSLMQLLVDAALAQPQVFVHRDFHSRNLLINADNPGVIDYQDALRGPLTYDLVSLLKDCYIKWPRQRVEHWVRSYYRQLSAAMDLAMDAEAFLRSFDLIGVQRHLKASGIFARLCHRDGKSGYLQDIPRTLSYISDLQAHYPELEFLLLLLQERVLPKLGKPA